MFIIDYLFVPKIFIAYEIKYKFYLSQLSLDYFFILLLRTFINWFQNYLVYSFKTTYYLPISAPDDIESIYLLMLLKIESADYFNYSKWSMVVSCCLFKDIFMIFISLNEQSLKYLCTNNIWDLSFWSFCIIPHTLGRLSYIGPEYFVVSTKIFISSSILNLNSLILRSFSYFHII